jgi:hypothetical protein
MTLQEAKILAQQGIKVTHEYFADNEWLIMHNNLIKFEDGVTIFFDEWVEGKDWVNEGWSEFQGESVPTNSIINIAADYIINNPYAPYMKMVPPIKQSKQYVDVRTTPKYGRNEPCHCGSGLKYKKCCI